MAHRLIHRDELTRLIRFGVVGGTNGAATLLVYWVLAGLGVPYLLAAVLGYAAGMVNGYTWNRLWTFETGSFHGPEFVRYVLVQGTGLVVNLVGLAFAIEALGIDELLAELLTLVPIVLGTYWLNRYWAFRARPSTR
ncbi:MAG TPA: GtrA family protein [Solirubrobacterales bacterium]